MGFRSWDLAFCGGQHGAHHPIIKVDFKTIGVYTKSIYDIER